MLPSIIVCIIAVASALAPTSAVGYYRGTSNMAIVRSLAIGKSRKSAGNLTFRTVRGRTIASEKRGKSTSILVSETLVQFVFALGSRFIRMHRASIDVSFNKSKFGSQGNYFQKLNKQGLLEAFTPLYGLAQRSNEITDAQIEQAITTFATDNPTVIFRVLKAGEATKYLTGSWDNADDPSPTTSTIGLLVNGTIHKGSFKKGEVLTEGLIAGPEFVPTEMPSLKFSMLGMGDAGITSIKTYKVDGTLAQTFDEITKISENVIQMDISGAGDPFAEAYDVSFLVFAGSSDATFNGSFLLLN